MSENTNRQHYYLISGEVVFLNGKGGVGNVRQNGVICTSENRIPAQMIGRAQQILQVNFHERLLKAGQKPEQLPQIVDVVIYTISHLGMFTEAEFQPPKSEEEKEA